VSDAWPQVGLLLGSPKGAGTAFLAGAVGQVLTAKHLVESLSVVRVRFPFGEREAEVVYCSESQDIALLRLTSTTGLPDPLPLGSLPTKLPTNYITWGYRREKELICLEGRGAIRSRLANGALQLETRTQRPGMSGSPLCVDNVVVGIGVGRHSPPKAVDIEDLARGYSLESLPADIIAAIGGLRSTSFGERVAVHSRIIESDLIQLPFVGDDKVVRDFNEYLYSIEIDEDWAHRGQVWSCLVNVPTPSIESILADDGRKRTIELMTHLLEEKSQTESLLYRKSQGCPALMVLPEYALSSPDVEAIQSLIKSQRQKLIVCAGFGFTNGGVIRSWIQESRALPGWNKSAQQLDADLRYSGILCWIHVPGVVSECYIVLRNSGYNNDQRLSITDLGVGEQIFRIRTRNFDLIPICCVDCVDEGGSNITKLVIDSIDSERRTVLCGLLYDSTFNVALWQKTFGRLWSAQNTENTLVLSANGVCEDIYSLDENTDEWRMRNGVFFSSSMESVQNTNHYTRQLHSCFESGIVLREMGAGVAGGALRWPDQVSFSSTVWEPTWRAFWFDDSLDVAKRHSVAVELERWIRRNQNKMPDEDLADVAKEWLGKAVDDFQHDYLVLNDNFVDPLILQSLLEGLDYSPLEAHRCRDPDLLNTPDWQLPLRVAIVVYAALCRIFPSSMPLRNSEEAVLVLERTIPYRRYVVWYSPHHSSKKAYSYAQNIAGLGGSSVPLIIMADGRPSGLSYIERRCVEPGASATEPSRRASSQQTPSRASNRSITTTRSRPVFWIPIPDFFKEVDIAESTEVVYDLLRNLMQISEWED